VSFLSNSGPIASAGRGTIAWKRVDNPNAAAETLLSGQMAGPPFSWSPDGRVLALVNLDPVTRQDTVWEGGIRVPAIVPLAGRRARTA
jgi:hypothetical protein